MLKWFRRRGAPSTGPDYRHIDTREKAEALYRQGKLSKLLLLPSEFGGEDVALNTVYVPADTAVLKARLDQNTIAPMAERGQVSRYTAKPEYDGNSFVPCLIRIEASDPGHFEGQIAIWGKALAQNPAPDVKAADVTEFSLASTSVEGAGPEALVLMFIADYERWNNHAFQISEPPTRAAMEAAESAYAELLRKFCEPGLQHQPIAFGSDPSHDRAREEIVGADIGAEISIVRTRQTKLFGETSIASDYEYHLKKAGQRWLLTSLLYVDQDGKYECL